jgi:spermidine synthase
VVALVAWFPAAHLVRTYFRSGGHVEATREGATTTAAVAARFAYGERYYMELLTPGVSMSDTRLGSRRYMAMLAHAGMLAARTPERALLVCYGVGNTARSLLAHPELRQLDVVDIASEVLALAPHFSEVHGGNPLADDRVNVFVDDGRHHLIVRDRRYDVITSEPPPPNHAGVVNLYSREFYRLARARLRPGGVVSQWLPMFQLSIDDARAMAAGFIAELPYAALLYGQNEHFVLIGSDAPLVIDPDRARRLGALPRMQRELARSGIGGVADIYGSVVLTGRELRAWVRGVRPLADDRPTIQYPWQPLSGHGSYAALFGSDPARAFALLPPVADLGLLAEVVRAARATARAVSVIHQLPAPAAIRTELRQGHAIYLARRERPSDEGLLKLIGIDHELAAIAQQALARPGALALLERPVTAARATGQGQRQDALRHAALTLARRALYTDRPEEALLWLRRIERIVQHRAYHDFLIASALRQVGQTDAARLLYEQAANATRDPALRAQLTSLAQRANDPSLAAAGPFATE